MPTDELDTVVSPIFKFKGSVWPSLLDPAPPAADVTVDMANWGGVEVLLTMTLGEKFAGFRASPVLLVVPVLDDRDCAPHASLSVIFVGVQATLLLLATAAVFRRRQFSSWAEFELSRVSTGREGTV